MKSTKERLKAIRLYLGDISQQKLGDSVDFNANTIGTVEKKENSSMPYRLAAAINKKYPEISVDWMMTGEGEMIVKKTNTLAMRDDFDAEEKMKNWGERLEKIQLENKLSNKQFASLIGIDVEKYFKICATSPKPSIEILDAAVENFDVSLDWLLYGEGSPNCSSGLKD